MVSGASPPPPPCRNARGPRENKENQQEKKENQAKPKGNQRKPRFLTHPIGGGDWAADAYGDPSHSGGGTGDQQLHIKYI